MECKTFSYFQPTEIRFGTGRVSETGVVAARFGRRALLVTEPEIEAVKPAYQRLKDSLDQAGLVWEQFNGVVPNPTTDSISAGATLARELEADVIIGLGGGSSMDTAKAIVVEASHPGCAWDYLFYKSAPTADTLPVIAVSTTSGTGSQVTQVAVLTNPRTRDKSAIYHPHVFPKVAIVDPELMLTVPPTVTAATGFDAFTHAFESLIHPNCNPYIEILAWDALSRVIANLPVACHNGHDLACRTELAWADTLAGLCIAGAGVTLPHGIGMAIGGMFPHVAHGQALAAVYPAFARWTGKHAVAAFAKLARLLNPDLPAARDEDAADAAAGEIEKFLTRIGLRCSLPGFNISDDELPALAHQSMVLPDYQGNPYLIKDEAEMTTFLRECR